MSKNDDIAELDETVKALIVRHRNGANWEAVATVLVGNGIAMHMEAVGLPSTVSLLRALAEAIEEHHERHGVAIH